jgi:hypothetical protein
MPVCRASGCRHPSARLPRGVSRSTRPPISRPSSVRAAPVPPPALLSAGHDQHTHTYGAPEPRATPVPPRPCLESRPDLRLSAHEQRGLRGDRTPEGPSATEPRRSRRRTLRRTSGRGPSGPRHGCPFHGDRRLRLDGEVEVMTANGSHLSGAGRSPRLGRLARVSADARGPAPSPLPRRRSGPIARPRPTPDAPHLPEPDRRLVEAIARRVVELLGTSAPQAGTHYVDAATIAGELGVERDWVYDHASQLGAIRLGGPQGRLRFDREVVRERLGGVDAGSWRPPRRPPRRASPKKAPSRKPRARQTGRTGGA